MSTYDKGSSLKDSNSVFSLSKDSNKTTPIHEKGLKLSSSGLLNSPLNDNTQDEDSLY